MRDCTNHECHPAPYRIFVRQQDSGWESYTSGLVPDETWLNMTKIIDLAWNMAGNPTLFGMIKVVDANGKVVVDYGAGENSKRPGSHYQV